MSNNHNVVSETNSSKTIPTSYPAILTTETRQFEITVLDNDSAFDHFVKVFKSHSAALLFENYLYFWMDRLCEDYKNGEFGHFWKFYKVCGSSKKLTPEEIQNLGDDYIEEDYSSEFFYSRPDTDNPKQETSVFVEMSGFKAKMSLDAACITASIFALSHLAEKFYERGNNEAIVYACDYMKDLAEAHPESRLIFRAID